MYLLPYFGNTPINEITLASVRSFRSDLCALINEDGSKRLSNKRVNLILVPLISILHTGAEEFDFNYPLEKLKALREEKPDPKPLTQDEVSRFLECAPAFWYDYYLIRFYTGMRSCEVAGLHLDHIDFDQRMIKVRRNFVNGEFTSVKTVKSRREIQMTQQVYEAFERVVNQQAEGADFLFANEKAKPIDTRYVAKYVWYPTLAKAGLAARRPYQTRHTSAVLHLAAHENPLFVSRLLGHAGTKMLYEVYAPYVHNAARNDGSAFEAMMGTSNSNCSVSPTKNENR
ncbi:tyrosine-type recombinase/integrase [Colwelliaceae bacterium BS250]